MNRSGSRRDFLLITFAGVLFALSPAARAVDPPPDGGYLHRNTAEGTDALFNLDTSQPFVSDNTAIGFDALFRNTTGFGNTANGSQALYSNTIGGNNTAAGVDTLYFNTTGSGNTATGWAALRSGRWYLARQAEHLNGEHPNSRNSQSDPVLAVALLLCSSPHRGQLGTPAMVTASTMREIQ